MTMQRLPAEERKHFTSPGWPRDLQFEPALGTLDERLGIILRRHGGKTRMSPMPRWERDYLKTLALRAGMTAMVETS